MEVTVITTGREALEVESTCRKDTDISKPGNRKWLMSHIRWATENGKAVTIHAR